MDSEINRSSFTWLHLGVPRAERVKELDALYSRVRFGGKNEKCVKSTAKHMQELSLAGIEVHGLKILLI